jgi:hypothetical protein
MWPRGVGGRRIASAAADSEDLLAKTLLPRRAAAKTSSVDQLINASLRFDLFARALPFCAKIQRQARSIQDLTYEPDNHITRSKTAGAFTNSLEPLRPGFSTTTSAHATQPLSL